LNGIQEVSGSIPLISTKTNHKALALWFVLYKRKKRNRIPAKRPGMYCNRSTFPAFFRSVRFVDYAWFVRDCLLVLVIALAMPFEYTWVATKGKETGTMAEKKNLCAQIPTALHEQVCEAREAAGLTAAPEGSPTSRK
jgi:hypothetical protein